MRCGSGLRTLNTYTEIIRRKIIVDVNLFPTWLKKCKMLVRPLNIIFRNFKQPFKDFSAHAAAKQEIAADCERLRRDKEEAFNKLQEAHRLR
jgi:hypothetical protein